MRSGAVRRARLVGWPTARPGRNGRSLHVLFTPVSSTPLVFLRLGDATSPIVRHFSQAKTAPLTADAGGGVLSAFTVGDVIDDREG